MRESHMVLEVGQLCKTLAANFAGKRFLPGVNELVPGELGRCGELFSTVWTFVAPVVHCGRVGIAIGTSAAGGQLEVQRQTHGEIKAASTAPAAAGQRIS